MNASPFSMKLINKQFPQPLIFLVLAFLLILISVIPGNVRKVDIHIADTYYVIPAFIIERQLALGFIFLASVCYFIYKLPVAKALAWLHFILTFIGLIVFLYSIFANRQHSNSSSLIEYNRGMQILSGNASAKFLIAAVGFVMMMLAQILLFVNLMFGLIRQFNRN